MININENIELFSNLIKPSLSETDSFFDSYAETLVFISYEFAKLKIDLSKDYERIISGVNLLRLKNNPIHLKKSDIKTILLKK